MRGEYRQQSLMLSRYRGSPRLRGEYMSAASNITSAPGSPPLARGIQLIPGRRVSAIGITPACAGNTRRLTMAGCQYRDHPRLRGEYKLLLKRVRYLIGSPPLARGILRMPPQGCQENRITPACAGNTGSSGNSAKIGRDHPRLRGEYSSIPSTSASI